MIMEMGCRRALGVASGANNGKARTLRHGLFAALNSGVPKGIRTPVTAVKGRCPRPLDDGDAKLATIVLVELGGIEPPTSTLPV